MKAEYGSKTTDITTQDTHSHVLRKRPKISGWFSAPVIILFWLLFFPIGMYLTYKRAKIDKAATVKIGNIITTISVILFAIVSNLYEFYGDRIEQWGGFLFISICIGIYIRISGKKMLKYIALLETGNRSIEEIAKQMNVGYYKAKTKIEELIKLGYFEGCYINESMKCVEFNSDRLSSIEKEEEQEPCAVTCKNCGAPKNILKGSVSKCDYCGSALETN